MRKNFLFVILISTSILSLTASLDSGKMPLDTEPIWRGVKNKNKIKKEDFDEETKTN